MLVKFYDQFYDQSKNEFTNIKGAQKTVTKRMHLPVLTNINFHLKDSWILIYITKNKERLLKLALFLSTMQLNKDPIIQFISLFSQINAKKLQDL